MAEFIPPIVVDIISRSTGFAEGVDKAKADMSDLSTAAGTAAGDTETAMADADQSVDEHAGKIGSNMEALAGDVAGGLGSIPGHADDAVKGTEKVDKGAEKMAGDVGKHAEKSGGAFKKFAGVVGDALNDLGLPIGSASSKLGGVGEAAEGSEGMLGKFALGGAAAVAVVAAAAVDLGVHMDDADAKIATATGVSIDAATRIGNAFLGMGGKTESSGEQLAGAYAAVAGQLKATEGHTLSGAQAASVMAAASNLAESSQTDLGSATTAVSGIMQSFGLQTAAAAHVSDVLHAASQATGVSVTSLASSLEKARSKLGDTSGSVGDLSSLLVDLAEHGVTGRAAMSVLNGTMNTLQKSSSAVQTAVANQKDAYDQMSPSLQALANRYSDGSITAKQYSAATQGLPADQAALATQFASASAAVEKAKGAYQGLGITVFNQQGRFVGLASVIAQLHPKFADMTQQQQLAAATTLFGASAARQMTEIVKAGPTAYDKASASVNAYGSAQAGARTEQHSLGGELKVFLAAIEDIGTKVGEDVLPPLTSLAQTVLPWVEDLLHGVVGVFSDLGAAWKFLGPLHTAIIAVAAAFGIWELATVALNVVMDANPIVLVIAAIVALVVAVVEIVKHFHTFEHVAEEVWHKIESVVTGAVHGVAHAISDVLGAIVGTLAGIWHTIERDVSDVWDSIRDFFTRTLGHIASDVEKFVGGLVLTVENAGAKAFMAAVHFAESIVKGMAHGLLSLGSVVEHAFKKIPVVGGLISTVSHFLAAGGVAVKPTIAMIGEGSEPEAVLPLSQLRQLLAGNQGDFYPAQQGAQGFQAKAGGLTVGSVVINGSNQSNAQIINELYLKLRPFLSAPAY